MKKILLYLSAVVALVATSCTDFGVENQLTLPDAPGITISSITAESDSITFTVAPSGEAGFYSWLVVESDEADESITAEQVLKLLASGVANGVIDYKEESTKTIGVGGLTPFTVYQIYAVAGSTDGVIGNVVNSSIRTEDDGSLPGPKSFKFEDTTVTITFNEPLQKGTGKAYASYFAINTLSGGKPLNIKSGFESFNPQDIEIPPSEISVSGTSLVINLPAAPAGAYASITFDEGVVTDLEGNASKPFSSKADTIVDGVLKGGITVRVANEAWSLHSEFEETKPDTLISFTDWENLEIVALPDSGITVVKTIAKTSPTVIYKEHNKSTTIDIAKWDIGENGEGVFYLPEKPSFGATVDISIPEGAFEDVYGNSSDALVIKDNYLYSYGYEFEDVTGTYDLDVVSYWGGSMPTKSGIIIEKDVESDTLLIRNLLVSGTVVKGVLDPVFGTIAVENGQFLANLEFSFGFADVVFVNALSDDPVVFNVPAPGLITSSVMWGFDILPDKIFYDAFTSSRWTRTSTSTETPASEAAAMTHEPIVIEEGRQLKR